jgi:predicted nucleic acid-binding protein
VTRRGLLDTSVFIARESGRELEVDALPDEGYVCVVTVGELHAGVLATDDIETRARRFHTARQAAELVALPVGSSAALHWGRLRAHLAEADRRVNVNDLWIAAVALAHEMPVVTQDRNFDALAELGLLEVIRV